MAVPTLVSGLSLYAVLYLAFYWRSPSPGVELNAPPGNTGSEMEKSPSFNLDYLDPRAALKSVTSAIFGVSVLVVTLAVLTLSSFFELTEWEVTLPAALVMLAHDICVDFHRYFFNYNRYVTMESEGKDSLIIGKNQGFLSYTWRILSGLPWSILPFILGMFVMVEALQVVKLLPYLAEALAVATLDNTYMGIFVVGVLSTIVCNIISNIPMTILFTRMLQHDAFVAICRSMKMEGSALALVIGSNFGANFTLIGELAGIMWNAILRQRGMEISYFRFLKTSLLICPWVLAVTLAVLGLVSWLFVH